MGDFNYEQRKSLEKSRLRIPRRYCLIGGGLYFISISAYVGCIGVPYSDMDDYKILSAKKQENEK